MANTGLVPGFRFHPTAVELVMYFLKRKVLGENFPVDIIAEIDIYKNEPWDLPDKSLLKDGDLEWYFFCPRGKKYASGRRVNRATHAGFWKTTGMDRSIKHKNEVVGMIKTLVFHLGKAPKGDRTNWVMHEFRLEHKELADKGISQDSYVICKVFEKEGPGPRNGAQYGKPFNEEEWDEEEKLDNVEPLTVVAQPAPVPIQPTTYHGFVANDMHPSTSWSCLSGWMPCCLTHPSVPPSNQADDDTLSILDYFKGDNPLALNENNRIEEVDNPGQANNAEGTPCFDPSEFLEDLGDLDGLVGFGEDGHGFPCGETREYTTNEMLSGGGNYGFCDPSDYLTLSDLDVPLLWQD